MSACREAPLRVAKSASCGRGVRCALSAIQVRGQRDQAGQGSAAQGRDSLGSHQDVALLLDDECALDDHYVMSIAASLREEQSLTLSFAFSFSGAPEERLTRAPRGKPLAKGDSANGSRDVWSSVAGPRPSFQIMVHR